jgi:Protein of unknown function (DUF1682)
MAAAHRAAVLLVSVAAFTQARADIVASPAPGSLLDSIPDIDPVWMKGFELMLVILIIVYVINYFIGASQNQALADSAVAALNSALVSQFACLGVDGKKYALLKDGPANFVYYATGRQFTTGLIIALDYSHRMDLLYRFASLWETPLADRCTLFLPLVDDFAMEPISFFMSRRKELERLRVAGDLTSSGVKAIESLAGVVVGSDDLSYMGSDEFVILADHADVISAMLPRHAQDLLASVAPVLQSIHVTDSGAPWDHQCAGTKRMVRLVFTLPSNTASTGNVVTPMVKLAMHLVDASATVKLSYAAKTRGMELRRAAKADEDKIRMKKLREDAEQRKIEKRMAEDAKVSKLSAAQQAKYDEKVRKRAMMRRMKKTKG